MTFWSERTRRRFLTLAGVGLATGLAGCNDGMEVRQPDGTPANPITAPGSNDDTDDEVAEPPDEPPAHFRSDTAGEFTLWSLPDFRGTWDDLTRLHIMHPDDRIIDATVDGDTARFEFPAKITRDLDFTLYIRDVNGNFQTKERRVPAPNGEATYEEISLTFELSDVPLPTNVGGFVELTVTDSHLGYDDEHLFKRHQFAAVEHADGVRWFNDATLNVQNYIPEGGRRISKTPTMYDGVMATEDNGNRRTVFLVSRVNSNGEVFGVSTTVDKGFVRKYRDASASWRRNHEHRWECHYATRVSHLRELAQKTDAAITGLGITRDIPRLNAVADLIQNAVPYGTPIQEECPPIIVLHEKLGDCSEKSALLAGILANDPWNIRTGYIDCYIGDTYHWTLGIDKRDFNGGDNIHWVKAKNAGPRAANLPDTEYAFLEMTSDSRIGEISGAVTKINGIYDTGTFEYQDHGSNTPPNY